MEPFPKWTKITSTRENKSLGVCGDKHQYQKMPYYPNLPIKKYIYKYKKKYEDSPNPPIPGRLAKGIKSFPKPNQVMPEVFGIFN